MFHVSNFTHILTDGGFFVDIKYYSKICFNLMRVCSLSNLCYILLHNHRGFAKKWIVGIVSFVSWWESKITVTEQDGFVPHILRIRQNSAIRLISSLSIQWIFKFWIFFSLEWTISFDVGPILILVGWSIIEILDHKAALLQSCIGMLYC